MVATRLMFTGTAMPRAGTATPVLLRHGQRNCLHDVACERTARSYKPGCNPPAMPIHSARKSVDLGNAFGLPVPRCPATEADVCIRAARVSRSVRSVQACGLRIPRPFSKMAAEPREFATRRIRTARARRGLAAVYFFDLPALRPLTNAVWRPLADWRVTVGLGEALGGPSRAQTDTQECWADGV